MIINLLIKRIQAISQFYQSFVHKMVAQTNWHRYGTKLRHCHPMYTSSRTMSATFHPRIDDGRLTAADVTRLRRLSSGGHGISRP